MGITDKEIMQFDGTGETMPITDNTISDLADALNSTFSFAKLSDHDKETVLKALLFDYAKEDLRAQVDAKRINVPQEMQVFLETYKSKHTRSAYMKAINRFSDFVERRNVSFISTDARTADDFIYDLVKHDHRAPESIRLEIAAISSFYTFLERRYPEIARNPFRGTKARPKHDHRRECIYPSKKEVETILKSNTLSANMKAAVYTMAVCGLRVGGLPGMHIDADGKTFTTFSKGKKYTGKLPAGYMARIAEYGKKGATPFQDLNPRAVSVQFIQNTHKLHDAGKIAAPYSCHDLRHHYARTEYEKDRDIYRVSKLLNHATIQVTETYLKELNVIQ